MNKINATIIILMISVSHLLCQEDCKYGEYTDLIISALEDASFNRYQQANKKYQLAFSKVDIPYSANLTSAMKIAQEVRDTTWIKEIAKMLAKGGIPLEYFNDFSGYEWYNQFKSNFNEYKNYYESSFDLKLRSSLFSLRELDSINVDNYHKWRKGEIELTLKELIESAKSIFEGFKNLVKEHGFPCERRMGYYYKNGEISTFPVLIILIHIYQRGELLYKEELPKLVCEGKIRFIEEMQLEQIQGFGDSTGIEQEMKIRFEKYGSKN